MVSKGWPPGLVGPESAINGGLATRRVGTRHPFLDRLCCRLCFLRREPQTRFPHAARRHFRTTRMGWSFTVSCTWMVMPLAYPVVHPSISRDLTAVCVHHVLNRTADRTHRAPVSRRGSTLNSSTINLFNDRSSRFHQQSRPRHRQLARPRRGDDQGLRQTRRAMRRQLRRRLRPVRISRTPTPSRSDVEGSAGHRVRRHKS